MRTWRDADWESSPCEAFQSGTVQRGAVQRGAVQREALGEDGSESDSGETLGAPTRDLTGQNRRVLCSEVDPFPKKLTSKEKLTAKEGSLRTNFRDRRLIEGHGKTGLTGTIAPVFEKNHSVVSGSPGEAVRQDQGHAENLPETVSVPPRALRHLVSSGLNLFRNGLGPAGEIGEPFG